MPLLILDANDIDEINTKIEDLFESGKITEEQRNDTVESMSILPLYEHDDVYIQDRRNYREDGSLGDHDVDVLVNAGVFEEFSWVTDDVEYTEGMCSDPIEAIDFAEGLDELATKWYIVSIRDYDKDTMPSVGLDFVAGSWGKYVFKIALVKDVK